MDRAYAEAFRCFRLKKENVRMRIKLLKIQYAQVVEFMPNLFGH